jgi:hypothetical protein
VRIVADELRAEVPHQQAATAVGGLNPHAGEGGYLGREIEIITPAFALREQGIDASGPFPRTRPSFRPSGEFDCVIAMYHDQGLPVLKRELRPRRQASRSDSHRAHVGDLAPRSTSRRWRRCAWRRSRFVVRGGGVATSFQGARWSGPELRMKVR